MEISDTSPTPFQAQVAEDVAGALLGEFACRAIYHPKGLNTDPRELTVVCTLRQEDDRAPARAGQSQPSHRRRVCDIMVGADEENATIGGVARLQSGDWLEVPGGAVGRPDLAKVTVTIGDKLQLVERAYWTAEGAIT